MLGTLLDFESKVGWMDGWGVVMTRAELRVSI